MQLKTHSAISVPIFYQQLSKVSPLREDIIHIYITQELDLHFGSTASGMLSNSRQMDV